ncbi:molecular chaperone FimC, partial [Enterobacter hormaechei subsp. steigerwaltii]
MRIITSRCKLTCLIAGALTALFAMGVAGSASAGGIALGGTRVIYPQGDKQASLAII